MTTATTWEIDYQERANPELLTRLLRAGVPVLEFTKWKVLETRPGYCKALLPISLQSSNQHGVHQAALIGLSADYTAGIAIGSLIHGVPIIGVHPKRNEEGAALWASTLSLQYKSPSSEDLIAVSEIQPERWNRIRRRFTAGNTVLERVTTSLRNGDQEVATAEGTYFMRNATMLRPESRLAAVHPLFEQKVKASARLVAALRARETLRESPLVHDPYAFVAAGDHGKLLAERLLASSPQIQAMVAARTKHIDDLIRQSTGVQQVVLLGAGFDFRPFRLAFEPTLKIFEVDFPFMLLERERLISELQLRAPATRYSIGCDMESEDLEKALLDDGFDPSLKTIFIEEGTSMYLDEEANGRTLSAIASLMNNRESLVWIDYVQREIFRIRHSEPSVDTFLDSMERLGEPFISGVEDASEWFNRFGLSLADDVDTTKYHPEFRGEPVYPLYRFGVGRKTT
jgi:methyltransferase (TIGR00027 family)